MASMGFWVTLSGYTKYSQVHAAGPGVLQKLGRVLKEKAVGDFERVFQGTSKTREKLGVRCSAGPHACNPSHQV